MAGRKRTRPQLVKADPSQPHRTGATEWISSSAPERIEDLIVNCELKPGRFLSIQDLQEITGLSRTPCIRPSAGSLTTPSFLSVRGMACRSHRSISHGSGSCCI